MARDKKAFVEGYVTGADKKSKRHRKEERASNMRPPIISAFRKLLWDE